MIVVQELGGKQFAEGLLEECLQDMGRENSLLLARYTGLPGRLVLSLLRDMADRNRVTVDSAGLMWSIKKEI
jgi:hypothetical protein